MFRYLYGIIISMTKANKTKLTNSSNTDFFVQVLGIGNSGSALYYRSSFLINAGGKYTLVDCPDPIQKILRESSIKSGNKVVLQNIEDIIITHIHGDHCHGIESFGFENYKNKHFGTKLNFPTIYTLDIEGLWNRFSGSMGTLVNPFTQKPEQKQITDYFNIGKLNEIKNKNEIENKGITKINNLELKIYKTKHHEMKSFGFIAKYEWRSIGYSADTSFDPKLIKFMSDCDLIIHECNGTLPGIHTGYYELNSLPSEIRDKMYLIHCPDHFDRSGSKIKLLEEGKIIKL